jgi:hypothetical protein
MRATNVGKANVGRGKAGRRANEGEEKEEQMEKAGARFGGDTRSRSEG